MSDPGQFFLSVSGVVPMSLSLSFPERRLCVTALHDGVCAKGWLLSKSENRISPLAFYLNVLKFYLLS